MDPIMCGNVMEEDYKNLKISVLQLPTRDRLSCMLNTKKVLCSSEKLPRDWRGLCTLLKYTIPSGCDPNEPINKIFKFCEFKTTIADFLLCLERIDRFDVIDDTIDLISCDIVSFKEKQYSIAIPTPVIHHDDFDNNIITLDDDLAFNNGLPLPRYDAFLLYDDADIQLAATVVDKLETEYALKLCLKERDLRPGIMFEYMSIMKLISDRCNWLIIILTDDFLNSPWNRFIMNYTQSLAIEQRLPKIIPCVFNNCILPEELKCYVNLYFNKYNPFCDPWYKLRITVSPNSRNKLTNSNQISKIDKSTNKNSSVTVIEHKDPVVISCEEQIEEHNISTESQNISNRLAKSFKNVSIRVIPKKWKKKLSKKIVEGF
ncbi:Toll/interleukin-1 receptor homology (TIR) domain [Cinara cedri]|uniref:Toll/interleukin-1 receptor homology (TIR) domain n=1 Tax=Cinara cedri TaxID=506608 RepID=A0A5E4NB75_9HEMI|nr:Toll/interleukin-1 receptor homology (TIR) domain [Cinara cedri]